MPNRGSGLGAIRMRVRFAALTACLLTASAAQAGSAQSAYYERSVMLAADERCHLFPPEIAAALSASSLQARGALLRGGAEGSTLAGLSARAKLAAYSLPCGGADLKTAADRVRQGFAGYARISWMNFPGETATWQAERKPTAPVANHKPVDGPRWRLSEPGRWAASSGPAPTFGLTEDLNSPVLLAPVEDASGASSAFLIVRDSDKAALPYLLPGVRDLGARQPPRNITRSFVARSKTSAAASLFPKGQGSGTLFGFPAAAIKALEALDPREVITVEIAYPGRASRRAVFEVGDFAAGRAFLAVR